MAKKKSKQKKQASAADEDDDWDALLEVLVSPPMSEDQLGRDRGDRSGTPAPPQTQLR